MDALEPKEKDFHMRIIGSDILMRSQRSFASGKREETNLRIVNGDREINARSVDESFRAEGSAMESRQRFREATDVVAIPPGLVNNPSVPTSGYGTVEIPMVGDLEDDGLNPNLKLTKLLMEKVFGKKVKMLSMKFEASGAASIEGSANSFGVSSGPVATDPQAPQGPRGFGLAYDRTTTTYESENTNFKAGGTVKTADGKEIKFNLELNMSREFVSHEQESIRMGVLTDPLVLNFDGGAAELSDARFSFDLDADGDEEQMHMLKAGSAFLAYDRNNDGTINDGSELFGTQSGDGFADLAAYDDDGNQFIDEGDEIFSKLSVYNRTGQGETLTSLTDAGVGAIYLGSASTEFSINNVEDNTQRGQVRATGVFIKESGEVGTVQQVDLVTEDTPVEEATSAPTEANDAPPVDPTNHIDIQG